jgi:Ca2+-transporting ATPase
MARQPTGLSSPEARARLVRDGTNELPETGRRTRLRIVIEVLREPMLALLLAAGLIYMALGDRNEALILLTFACLSIIITVVQEARTERVLEAMRSLAAPHALVLRDGEAVRIPAREVVEADLLVLDAGDRVAADALLLEADALEVDESLLTGESVPVRKCAASGGENAAAAIPGGDDRPCIFGGTIVTRGRGLARVTATGRRSRIGQIGVSLADLNPQAPRLLLETAHIIRICALGGAGVAALVILLYGLLRGSWLDATLAGIAIGMSLLPEEFAVVLTIFLAMGAWRIAQVGVLTRRGTAIEALGAATVLCTDKTGTLTRNRMTVAEVWLPSETVSLFAEASRDPRYRALLETAMLASAQVPVDPMEQAFHAAAERAGASPSLGRELVRTHALRPDLLAMSNIWSFRPDDTPLTVAAKGAPEAIAYLCRLDGAARAAYDLAAQQMAERGMRVLGVASAHARRGVPELAHEDHAFELVGLVGLEDPLRAGVVDAIARLQAAGIRLVMITGDYPVTAMAIAAAAGLGTETILSGDELAALTDAELAIRIRTVGIFARIMPEQKLRIVRALAAAGEVVAMTGDGVNDAPALKAADIGIAMGRRGTDVAREAAAIVLVDDEFGAIVDAVRLGRRIYDNLRKAMRFILAAHVPIAVMAIVPLAIGAPLVLGPIQIALLEMIIDPICALMFEAEREESDLMRRPPRNPKEHLLSRSLVVRGMGEGLLFAMVVIAVYLAGHWAALPAAQLRTFAFFTLVVGLVALVLANRSFSLSFSHAFFRGNPAFRYVLASIAAASAAILTIHPMRRALAFAPLAWWQLGTIALVGIGLLLALEAAKVHSKR